VDAVSGNAGSSGGRQRTRGGEPSGYQHHGRQRIGRGDGEWWRSGGSEETAEVRLRRLRLIGIELGFRFGGLLYI
jgi:hypothetical protein